MGRVAASFSCGGVDQQTKAVVSSFSFCSTQIRRRSDRPPLSEVLKPTQLKEFKRVQAEEHVFQCPVDGCCTSGSSRDIIRHLNSSHARFHCRQCNQSFYTQYGCDAHVAREHEHRDAPRNADEKETCEHCDVVLPKKFMMSHLLMAHCLPPVDKPAVEAAKLLRDFPAEKQERAYRLLKLLEAESDTRFGVVESFPPSRSSRRNNQSSHHRGRSNPTPRTTQPDDDDDDDVEEVKAPTPPKDSTQRENTQPKKRKKQSETLEL